MRKPYYELTPTEQAQYNALVAQGDLVGASQVGETYINGYPSGGTVNGYPIPAQPISPPAIQQTAFPVETLPYIGAAVGAVSASDGIGGWIQDIFGSDQPGLDWQDILQFIAGFIPGTQESLGELPPGLHALAAMNGGVINSWSTGTVRIYRFRNGKLGCLKKNGVAKAWRAAKNLVIPRNPKLNDFLRAEKKLDRIGKSLRKKMRRR
jgi:hypothetical protein